MPEICLVHSVSTTVCGLPLPAPQSTNDLSSSCIFRNLLQYLATERYASSIPYRQPCMDSPPPPTPPPPLNPPMTYHLRASLGTCYSTWPQRDTPPPFHIDNSVWTPPPPAHTLHLNPPMTYHLRASLGTCYSTLPQRDTPPPFRIDNSVWTLPPPAPRSTNDLPSSCIFRNLLQYLATDRYASSIPYRQLVVDFPSWLRLVFTLS